MKISMKEYIIDNFSNIGSVNLNAILLNNVVAIIISFFILFTYRITYTGTAYSKKFNTSLGMITIITTLIMNVISSNIALSLGMVGALSIIRFRTAVKDIKDASYIFWCIAVGVCCGVSQYMVAIIGSIFTFLFLILMNTIGSDGKYLIIIKSSMESQNAVEIAMRKYFSNSARLRVRNTREEQGDLFYEVSKKSIDQAMKKEKSSITEKLMKIHGVISVEQIEQSNDISQ